ncbi:hypothetical protein BJ508DRAFT_42292 [Ascobolus immersus RN42]|uniref:Uncharacterized protein n=1 Tax=Ascobolus immersus RN42 TaxID=1160509 RepID=A0A3N4IHM1_ASCIM|nr:hypothetical protein BJ508DRAFT_42292 [Ascobolus immersus RN42]
MQQKCRALTAFKGAAYSSVGFRQFSCTGRSCFCFAPVRHFLLHEVAPDVHPRCRGYEGRTMGTNIRNLSHSCKLGLVKQKHLHMSSYELRRGLVCIVPSRALQEPTSSRSLASWHAESRSFTAYHLPRKLNGGYHSVPLSKTRAVFCLPQPRIARGRFNMMGRHTLYVARSRLSLCYRQ